MRPWWNPISAFTSPRSSVSVPVLPPRWMNCIASATETSWRLPERLMGHYCLRTSATRLSSVLSFRSVVE